MIAKECPKTGELLEVPDLVTVPATDDQMDADDWRELNGWLYRSLGDQRSDDNGSSGIASDVVET